MKLTIDIPEDQIEEFLRFVMQNMPEYAICMTCTSWKYEDMIFEFQDEDGKKHTVTMTELRAGFEKMARDLFENGKMPGIRRQLGDDWLDDCQWDAEMLDCLVQYAIFGKVIYG